MCQSTLSSNMSHESRMDDKQFDASKIAGKLVSLTSAVFDPKNQTFWVCISSESFDFSVKNCTMSCQ